MRTMNTAQSNLKTAILSSVFMLSAGTALAQEELNINNDAVTVTSGGGFNSGALTINSTTGIVPSVVIPQAGVTGGAAIPNFAFTMESNGVTDGTYTFKVGFLIDDDNSNRRLEISIPSITMAFSGSGATLAGSVPAGSSVNVRGRAADNTTQISASLSNTLLSFNGSSLSFTSGAQVTEIQGKGGILGDIATTIAANGAYTYAVVLKQLSGPATLNFGTESGGFSKLGCAPSDAFALGSNGSSFSGGFGLQGQFKIVSGTAAAAPTQFSAACTTEIASGGGGGGTTTTDASITNAGNDLTAATTPEAVATAVDAANTLATNVAAQIESGTADVSTGVSLLETLNTGISVIGSSSTTAGTPIDQSKVTDTLNSISSVITAVGTQTLTPAQLSSVQSTVVTTMSNLINTIPANADPAQTQATLAKVGEVLRKVSSLPGSTVTAALADGAKAISLNAAEKSVPALQQQLKLNFNISTVQQDLTDRQLQAFLRGISRVTRIPISLITITDTSPLLSSPLDVDQIGVDAVTLPAVGFDPSALSTESATGSRTVTQSFLNGIGITGATATYDATNRTVLLDAGGQKVPTYTTVAALVGSFISDGAYVNSDGSVTTYSDGVSVTAAPAPRDASGFFTALENASITSTVSEEGIMTLTAASGEKLSGSFGFDPVTIGTLNLASPQFGSASGDPASPDYVITVTYSDGAVQKFQPMLNALELLDSTASFGIYLSIDRATGLITGENGLRLRADYSVSAVTNADANYWEANKDSFGIALRQATDFNGDGTQDVEVITSSGKQVLYLLP